MSSQSSGLPAGVWTGALVLVVLMLAFIYVPSCSSKKSPSSSPAPVARQVATLNTSAPTPAPRYRPPPPPPLTTVVKLEFGGNDTVEFDLGSPVWVQVPDNAWVWYFPDEKQALRKIVRRDGPKGYQRYYWHQPLRPPQVGEKMTIRIYSYNPDK